MKAYVFYNTFMVNVQCKLADMYTDPEDARLAYSSAERCFLDSLKLSPHDTEIVKSLAKIVEEQVGNKGCQNNTKDSSAPKLGHLSCQLYK